MNGMLQGVGAPACATILTRYVGYVWWLRFGLAMLVVEVWAMVCVACCCVLWGLNGMLQGIGAPACATIYDAVCGWL